MVHQEPVISSSEKKDFGIIVAPPGSGKTVIGLKIIADKTQPALIIVHRKQLLDQWVERIQAFLNIYSSLSSLAFHLDNRYSNIGDVSARYYDLETRIKNKKALEQRYIKLLEKASVIKDILEIEKNLNEVRTEIEGLQGQFNYLQKQVNLSTINLSFYEILPYVYDSSERRGLGARVLSALGNGWQGFLSFLVGITTLWPFVILFTGGIFLFRKLRRIRKQRK